MKRSAVENGVPSPDRIVTLLKTKRDQTPDHTEYYKKMDDFWTLKLSSPFSHYWTFGYSKKCPLVNLTKTNEKKLLFAYGRFPVVYDYEYETMITLGFHKCWVDFLSIDRDGKLAVTADRGCESSIVIWSLSTFCPLHVIFEYREINAVQGVWLSPCGMFLAVLLKTENCRKLVIHDWATECVNTKAELILDQRIGKVVSVKFSNENSNYLVVTTLRNVIFLTFNRKNEEGKPEIQFHNAAFEDRTGVGDYTDSTYLDGTHLCYTSTVTGHVVVWSDLAFFEETAKIKPMSNKKDIVTYYRLLKCRITLIQGEGSYVVIGTEFGKVIFYDHTLKLVYWVQNEELDAISGISFNLIDEEPKEIDDAVEEEAPSNDIESGKIRANSLFILGKLCQKTKREVQDWQVNEEVFDASLSNRPFSVKNFIVCTLSGKVGYVNSSKKTIEFLLTNNITNAVMIECHPHNPYMVVATEQGALYLVDYEKNQEIVVRHQIPAGLLKRRVGGVGAQVTCLKYSCCGSYLACGMSDGYILFLKPLMLEINRGWTRQDGTDAVRIIKFSGDTQFCAYCDSKYIYFLSLSPCCREKPALLGKIRSHSRTITDLLFVKSDSDDYRCFSIAKDRFIVEYDLKASAESNKVVLKKRIRIEQRFAPLCMTEHPSCSKTIIIANSDYKFRLVNTERMAYRKTVAAPPTRKHITWLRVLRYDQSESEYALFVAGKTLGIIKMPFEVNPYRWITEIVGGFEVGLCKLSYRRNFLFTLSKGVGIVHMWRIMPSVLDVLGKNVDPYLDRYDRLFGNERDYLLEELKDYFIYSLLLHNGDCDLNPKRIRNEMYMCEVPDVLRAMGCFLTNAEFENIMYRGEEKDKGKIDEKKITFEELAELYANHRNSSATSVKALRRAFQRMCDFKTDSLGRKKKCISREGFIQFLESFGEQFTNCEAFNFLRILVKPITKEIVTNEEVEKFDFLPDTITYEYFKNTILGLSKKKRLQNELRAADHVLARDRLDAQAAQDLREVCEKENQQLRITLVTAAMTRDDKFEEVED